jgi:hypothetical protein
VQSQWLNQPKFIDFGWRKKIDLASQVFLVQIFILYNPSGDRFLTFPKAPQDKRHRATREACAARDCEQSA